MAQDDLFLTVGPVINIDMTGIAKSGRVELISEALIRLKQGGGLQLNALYVPMELYIWFYFLMEVNSLLPV